MKLTPSIKLKAVFLLAVFSLNTVVGFACSVGVDMGYNSQHHHKDEITQAVVHIHKDGKRHIHHEKKEKHSHCKSDQQSKHDKHHSPENEKDDCCSDEVRKFSDLDKAIPQTGKAPASPVFFSAFLSPFYNFSVPVRSQSSPDIKHFVRSYHPPISDIRIAIQSFQI